MNGGWQCRLGIWPEGPHLVGSSASARPASSFPFLLRYIDEQNNQQQLIMKKQDQDLEDISQHVVRIGEMGKTIGAGMEPMCAQQPAS